MNLYLSTLFLILSSYATFAKVTTGSLPIIPMGLVNHKKWEYLSKFVVGPSDNTGGHFKTKMKFEKTLAVPNQNLEASFLIYEEDQWNKAVKLPAEDCQGKKELAKFAYPVLLPSNGEWGGSIEGDLGKQSQIQVWFFAISDCETSFKPYFAGKRLKWEIEALNSNGSHFGEEESEAMLPLWIATVIITIFFMVNSIKFYKFYKSQESMDYPTMIVSVALLLEFCGLICEISHIARFAKDGSGFFALDLGNKLFSVLSQATISCLLLLIAYGWSINTIEMNKEDSVSLIALLFVSHLVIPALDVATEGSHYKFHDFESWAGVAIIALKLAILGAFLYYLSKTMKESSSDKQDFFKSFRILSVIYLMTFPCLVTVASFVLPAYMRHKVVYGGTLILQTVTLLIFTVLFSSKTTQYYKVSFKGRSFLPANKLH